MKKFLVVAAIAWGLSLAAWGRFTGGNAGISRYAGQPTTNGVYFWQSYYGHTYPYTSPYGAFPLGALLEDDSGLNDPGATNGPHRAYAINGEEPSYGALAYGALRASGRMTGAGQGRTAYYNATPA